MSVKSELVEARNELDSVNARLAKVWKQAGEEIDLEKVTEVEGKSSSEKAQKIRELNDAATELGKKVDSLRALETAAKAAIVADSTASGAPHAAPAAKAKMPETFTDVAQSIAASKAIKAYEPGSGVGPLATIDFDLKTLFARTAGWAPESLRSGRVLENAQRPVQVTELFPSGTITQAVYKYMEETTFTNAAAEASEGGTYAEAALALTERSQNVEKVAVWLPVTDEQLEDVAGVESYLESRLRFMIAQRLDSQLLNGNGTPPNILGVLNKPSIQTQARGTDNVPDAIHKAMTKVMVTGRAMPSAVVLHPNDWQDIRLLQTADGVYIWGNPADAGPERIWGRPVALSDAIAENTGLTGDFPAHSLLLMRRGLDVQVTNSHSTFFIEGKQAIRADLRVVLVVFRPQAFSTITGI